MGAVNIKKFLGEAPKLDPELLPAAAAQLASNVKLYSGDLLPYNKSSLQFVLPKPGPIVSIYPMDDGAGGFKWLHWASDVDVVRAPVPNNAVTQRVYYSGDSGGEPRATTYSMATTGAGTSYPYSYYTLGIPAPSAALAVSATTFASITGSAITSIVRDAGSIITVTTVAAHGLQTGAYVSVSGIVQSTPSGGALGNDNSYNVTNGQITVTGSNTFTYFSNGVAGVAAIVTGASPTTVALGGLQLARTYVYTWLTAWGEESAPAAASNTVYLKEGQTVTVTGIPAALPTTGAYAGKVYQTTGMIMNIYRTVTSTSGTSYYMAGQVHLGAQAVTYTRTGTVITVTYTNHYLVVGQAVTLGVTTGSASAGSYTVTSVVDANTITLTDAVSGATSGSGTVLATNFTDTQPLSSLTVPLPSISWYPPPTNLSGIKAIHNGMLMGFFGTTVCFSQPGQPHSWPTAYYQEIGRTVVGLGTVGTTVVVLTDSNPWVIQGNTPAAMQKVRLDTNMPCVSKRSIVNMDDGLYFATRGGIAVFSYTTGSSLATKLVYDWDNFRTQVDPTTITATRYNNKYFAGHSAGVFIFEKDDKVGGFLTETSQNFSAVFYNTNTAALFFAFGTPSTLYLWDDPTQGYQNFEWKSKVIRTENYMNLGAARVIANFDNGSGSEATNTILLQNNITLMTAHNVGGALAGNGNRFGPSPTGTQTDIGASLAGVPLGASRLKPLLATSATLQFYLYVNGVQALVASVVNDVPFRLPTGYRVDKFEIRITGNAPVKSIQLAETMQGLKEV